MTKLYYIFSRGAGPLRSQVFVTKINADLKSQAYVLSGALEEESVIFSFRVLLHVFHEQKDRSICT